MMGQSLSNTNETCYSVQIAKNCNLNEASKWKCTRYGGVSSTCGCGTTAAFSFLTPKLITPNHSVLLHCTFEQVPLCLLIKKAEQSRAVPVLGLEGPSDEIATVSPDHV